MRRWLAAIALTFFFPVAGAHAQANEQLWFEYMLNYPFANSWNVELAGTYSTALNTPKWRAFDVQVTPEYALSQHVDLMGALLVSNTFQNKSLNTFEVRPMVGTRLHFTPNKRLLTRLLVRLEQRNLENQETNEWDQSTRGRVRLETIFPFNKPTMFAGDQLVYGLLDAEAFLVLDRDVPERFANRLRIRTGIGYRFSYTFRVEFVYTLQRSRNALEDDFSTTDHIFRIRLKHYLRKVKPTNASGVGN
jgi:hypothetical protein